MGFKKIRVQYNLSHWAQIYGNLIITRSRFVPFGSNLNCFVTIWHPYRKEYLKAASVKTKVYISTKKTKSLLQVLQAVMEVWTDLENESDHGSWWPDLDPKGVRLVPNGDKSGTFFIVSQNILKSALKKSRSRICLIMGQSDPAWAQILSSWYS